MKNSEIYRQAARRLERGTPCGMGCLKSCCAISAVAGSKFEAKLEYQNLFLHGYQEENGWWNVDDEDLTDTRILALCFMAAIAEDAERKHSDR